MQRVCVIDDKEKTNGPQSLNKSKQLEKKGRRNEEFKVQLKIQLKVNN